MTTKMHPADIADREKIATATHFNVHQRRGPAEKINREATTLAEAVGIADSLAAEGGKPALIYAVTPEGFTVFVPKDMVDAERAAAELNGEDPDSPDGLTMTAADEAMKQPPSSSQICQLTAILTGGGFKRANSKAAAEARFIKVAAEHGISPGRAADLLEGPFDFAEHILRERIAGKGLTVAEVRAMNGGAPTEPSKRLRERNRKPSATQQATDGDQPAEKKAAAPASGKRAAIAEAAQRGVLPEAPDFSAETHKRFRPKLAKLVELAEAGDIAGLKAMEINPVSSSPKAMLKYRDFCVVALEARKAAA